MKNLSKLPAPTKENPYAQLDYLFMKVADTKHTQSSKENYIGALSFYKKFLNKTYNYDESLKNDRRFYLHKHLNEFALVKVKQYIDENNKQGSEGYLTSHTIVGYISSIRIVFQEALANDLFKVSNFIDVPMVAAESETDAYTAYSELEKNQIEEAIKEELKHVQKVYRKDGYRLTGVGEDPRDSITGGAKWTNKWTNIDNIRWYFENILNCVPIIGTKINENNHYDYFKSASRYFQDIGGLRGIYKKWGVTPLIDADIIMPLMVEIATLTGLNVQSIIDLEIDCFEEKNPMTGVPAIKYFKHRSGGAKEMHINTNPINDNIGIKEFRVNQVKLIGKTINMVLEITSEIRKNAPVELKRKLFIIQSASKSNLGIIMNVNKNITSKWYKKFVEKYDLKTDTGSRLSFNLRRFRSTKITDMVENGIDIFELQDESGHQNIQTTLNYISKNKLDVSARKETFNALNKIFENKSWVEREKPIYATAISNEKESLIYKGFVCDCKNPFNPPEDVKKLKEYKEGQACTRINMCMFCDNVLIFKRNLPSLWMYRKQIKVAIDNLEYKADKLPNQDYYLKTLNIIDALFDVEQSEFQQVDLEWAKNVAENMDELVDPLTFIAIKEMSG